MPYVRCVALLLALSAGPAAAGFHDLTAPVEWNTCRLANVYTVGGQDYSGAAGVTFQGKYPTADDRANCLKKCETEERERAAAKPAIYGLRVACFFGQEKLFERTH